MHIEIRNNIKKDYIGGGEGQRSENLVTQQQEVISNIISSESGIYDEWQGKDAGNYVPRGEESRVQNKGT